MTTSLNHEWWSERFREIYIPQVRSLVETLETRLLPAFDGIEAEADDFADSEYKRLGSLYGTEDSDPADFAEMALEEGSIHYETLAGLRQGMINMYATTIYHLCEQQIMAFHRSSILDPEEQKNEKLFRLGIFQKRLEKIGIHVKSFVCWEILEELRLVASTVKHAAGDSSKELHSLRPELFIHPEFHDMTILGIDRHLIFQPIIGEDLYVSMEDIRRYRDAIEQFWNELADAISREQ